MAFEAVRRRHAALRVCIADKPGQGPTFIGIDEKIPVRVVSLEHDWRIVVEGELNLPFETMPGPLMRATVVSGDDRASIVLTFHHAIADALSGTRLLEDLTRALAGEHLDILPAEPPLEAEIVGPPEPQGLGERRFSRNKSGPCRNDAQATANRATRISTSDWSETETRHLLERCRANGATVQGAICAAASRHLPTSDPNIVRMHCPIDLTRMIGTKVDGCGVFTGAGIVEVSTQPEKSLWSDARFVAEGLRTARSPAAVSEALRWIEAEFPPCSAPDRAREFFSSHKPSSIVVSNLGVLPLGSHCGSLQLESVWGPAMMTNRPANRQTLGVCTFAGRLRLVHQSYQPIQDFLGLMRDTLRSSC